jgi:signal peptide peptidase SppA
MLFPQLAQRLYNVPLALHPPKAEIVMAALAERLGVTRMMHNGRQVPLALEYYDDDDLQPVEETPYDRVGGVAVIPLKGTLVQRTGTMRPYSGMTGYDGIRKSLALALSDDTVDAVVLDIDSPGGECAGCFDLADEIYQARGQKPIRAILSENAFSAAYALASAADRITVPRTGGTGSIGIICLHVDMSQALKEAGLNVTMITFGARKGEGNEYQPLTEGALARFQADVDNMGEIFCETVARNRGLSVEAVRATEANTFLGTLGVEAGLADAVMAPDAAFRELLSELT